MRRGQRQGLESLHEKCTEGRVWAPGLEEHGVLQDRRDRRLRSEASGAHPVGDIQQTLGIRDWTQGGEVNLAGAWV